MKAEQLRKAILQMAIQGKLVPQDPNDEPASVLLEKIRAEKQRLIKEGKIKKDKVDSVIFKGEDNRHYEKSGKEKPVCIEDELPFEIPESWEWCRILNISKVLGGKRIPVGNKLTNENTGHIYIKVSDMKGGTVITNQLQYVPMDIYPTIANYIIKKEDIYITVAGTIGRVGCIPPELDGANLTENADRLVFKNLNKNWLIKCLQSQIIQRQIKEATTKVGQPKLAIARIEQFLIPLPPLAEQKRIVSEIEKYEPLITEYDKLEQQKTKLDNEIYDKLKKSILQYAIQGKLVPQDPTDEPASTLLEKIRAEKKAQLGKKYVDSYIYKGDDNRYYEKIGSNEPVLLENLPFEIPNSWAWARLEQTVIINPRSNNNDDMDVSFVEMKSLQDGFENGFTYETRKWAAVKSGFTHFQDNDVGFAKITPCFQNRKSAVFKNLQNSCGAGTTELHILRAYANTIISEYLLWYVKSPYFIEWGKQHFSGTAGQQRFGTEEVKKTYIPIPPLNEQTRIVNKIQQILVSIEKDET